MVIALERYLIPMISKNQDTAYKLALSRICTTLTKGWFRQFAIDNYPQLSILDKDLLSIAHDIINKYPLEQKKSHYKLKLDTETQAIFEPIRQYTEKISSFDDIDNGDGYETTVKRSAIKITSPVNDDVSITAIITTVCKYHDPNDWCTVGAIWSASVVILPSKDLDAALNNDEYDNDDRYYYGYDDPLKLHPHYEGDKFKNITSKHIFLLGINATENAGSWGIDKHNWKNVNVIAKPADYVANELNIPGFTGDLLFKYVLDYIQPELPGNGDTPIKQYIDRLKAEKVIPIEPSQHLWYYAWSNTLKTGKWSKF